MASHHGVVRWPFRIIGGLLGVAMIVLGVAAVAWSVRSVAVDGWRVWWSDYRELVAVHVTLLGFGITLVRAARTGRDPYVSDADDDAGNPESDPPSA